VATKNHKSNTNADPVHMLKHTNSADPILLDLTQIMAGKC